MKLSNWLHLKLNPILAPTLACALFLLATECLGQEEVPSEAPQQSAPPDLVLLTNGGMLRGTIIESIPGEYVVLTLTTGETRRIPSTEISFAGPAAGAPTASPPPPPPAPAPVPVSGVESENVRVQFSANQPNVTLQWNVDMTSGVAYAGRSTVSLLTMSFQPLCVAPCETALSPGTHRLALSDDRSSPVDAGFVEITGPGTLRGEYTSRRKLRLTGWLTMIGGMVAGMALAFGGGFGVADDNDGSEISLNWPFFYSGMAVIGVSMIAGVILAFQRDRASLEFEGDVSVSAVQ